MKFKNRVEYSWPLKLKVIGKGIQRGEGCCNLKPILRSKYLKSFQISEIWSFGNILAKRFLDQIILNLFSCAHTEKSQKNL